MKSLYIVASFLVRRSEIAHEADGFAEDADLVQLLADEYERVVFIVGREEGELLLFLIIFHALEGGLVVDDDGGDLSVIHHRLFADEYDVTVIDAGADHAIAFCTEAEVGLDVVCGLDIGFVILVRISGFTAGDVAQHTEPLAGDGEDIGGEGDCILATIQEIDAYAKEICNSFHHIGRRDSFSVFIHADCAFGYIQLLCKCILCKSVLLSQFF